MNSEGEYCDEKFKQSSKELSDFNFTQIDLDSILSDEDEEKTEEILSDLNLQEAKLWEELNVTEKNLRNMIKTKEEGFQTMIKTKEDDFQKQLQSNENEFISQLKTKEKDFERQLEEKEEELKNEFKARKEDFERKLQEEFKNEFNASKEDFESQLKEKEEEFRNLLESKEKDFERKIEEKEEELTNQLEIKEKDYERKLQEKEEEFKNEFKIIKEDFERKLQEKEEELQNHFKTSQIDFESKLQEKEEELQNQFKTSKEDFERKLKEQQHSSTKSQLSELESKNNELKSYLNEKEKEFAIIMEERKITIEELNTKLYQKEFELEKLGALKDYEFGTLDKARIAELLILGDQKRNEISGDELEIQKIIENYQTRSREKREQLQKVQAQYREKELKIENLVKEKKIEIITIEEWIKQKEEEYRYQQFEEIRIMQEKQKREINELGEQKDQEMEDLIKRQEREIEEIDKQNEEIIEEIQSRHKKEIDELNNQITMTIKSIKKKYKEEIRLLNEQYGQAIQGLKQKLKEKQDEIQRLIKEKEQENKNLQESIDQLEEELRLLEQQSQEEIQSLKTSISNKEKEILGLANQKKECIQRLRAAISKQKEEIDSLDKEIVQKYEEDEEGEQIRQIRIDDYSKTLKKKLLLHYPNEEILKLTCSCDIESLKDKYIKVMTEPQVLEYWSCLFLHVCREYGPCNSKFSFDSFLKNFDWAIFGAFNNGSQDSFEVFADSLDAILMTEIKDLHEKASFAEIIRMIQTFKKYEKYMQKYEFGFKNNAKDAITSITEMVKKSKGQVLGLEVSSALEQIIIANAPVAFERLLANLIFTYAEVINDDMLANPRAFHDQAKIEEAISKIQSFDRVCEDLMVRNWISRLLKKIEKITQNKVGLFSNDRDFQNTLPVDIHIIKITQLSINEYARCVSSINNIKASIHNGTYLTIPVCIKAYKPLSDNFEDLSEVFKEIRAFTKLSKLSFVSNNFLKYYGTCGHGNILFLVTEWFSESLADIIHKKTILPASQILEIFSSLVKSFCQMIENQVHYSDVNPFFLVKTQDSKYKVLNFDDTFIKINESRYFVKDFWDFEQTQKYFAPEKKKAIKKKNLENFDLEKANVFSLGIIFYQLITLKDVESSLDHEPYLDCQRFYEFNESVQGLLKGMLNQDYLSRPTFKELLGFLTKIR